MISINTDITTSLVSLKVIVQKLDEKIGQRIHLEKGTITILE